MFSRKYARRQAPWKMSRLPRFSCPPFGTAEAWVRGMLERSQWAKNGKRRLATEEFVEEEAGEGSGVVADDAVLFEEIVEDDAEAEILEGGKIEEYGFGALRAVAAGHVGRDGLAVGDDPIDDAARDVFLNRAEMIGEGIAGGFAGLGHQVGDVDARRIGLGDGAGNFRDQKIRKNAGVERARPEEDQVGRPDGVDGPGEGTHAARGELDSLDRRAAAGGDAGFAVHEAAIFSRGRHIHGRKRRRKNAAAKCKHLAADADGFRGIP